MREGTEEIIMRYRVENKNRHELRRLIASPFTVHDIFLHRLYFSSKSSEHAKPPYEGK